MLRAVAGLIPGGGEGHVLQANPALVRAAPLHTLGGGLLIDVDLGALGQGADLGRGNAGVAADVQVCVAADHAGVDGNLGAAAAAGAAIALAVHLDVVHVDPALVQIVVPLDAAPGGAAGDLLGFVDGNLGILGDGALQVGAGHARRGADIDRIGIDNLTGFACQGGIILRRGVPQIHIGQVDPAVAAVEGNLAPAAGAGRGVLILVGQNLDHVALLQGTAGHNLAGGSGSLPNIQGGGGHGAGGKNLVRGQILVLDVLVGHPTDNGLALGIGAFSVDPLDISNNLLKGDLELAVGLQGADIGGFQIRLSIHGLGSGLRGVDGILGSNLIGTVLPLGNQGFLGSGLVQNRNRGLGALLFVLQIPAQEGIPGLGGLQGQHGRGGHDVSVRLAHAGAAVAVENDVRIAGGRCAGVDVVQVQIGLGKTPVHQSPEVVRINGGAGPGGKGIDQLIALLVVPDRLTQRVGGAGPAASRVVGQRCQSVMLILGEGNVIILGEVIDCLIHHIADMVFQQLRGFGLGNPVHIRIGIGNACPVAYVPLGTTHILIGFFREALELLDHFDSLVAGLQRGGCRSSEHSGGH